MSDTDLGHGSVGQREQKFTHLLPLRAKDYNPQLLIALSEAMIAATDTVKDGADPEENLWVPAGYTYYGQFIDHDLTFDVTSSLDIKSVAEASNIRSPRFDLDCLYGDGPDAQPYLYENKGDGAGIFLITQDAILANPNDKKGLYTNNDLPRNSQGRALIGDKRNDENSIVCQIQLAFIKFHNEVAKKLIAQNKKITDSSKKLNDKQIFLKARDEVRWTHQKLLLNDFLPRIINREVLEDLQIDNKLKRAKNYALYTEDKRSNLPLEFVGAAYRFGHSGVRFGYRLNEKIADNSKSSSGKALSGRAPIFTVLGQESLVGFEPLRAHHEIDNWRRFFPDYDSSIDSFKKAGLGNGPPEPNSDEEIGTCRLQFAYKIDTSLVDPLRFLPDPVSASAKPESEKSYPDYAKIHPTKETYKPSLSFLNLMRGNVYRISSGQEVARALKAKGFPVEILQEDDLVIRIKDTNNLDKINTYNLFCPIKSIKDNFVGPMFDVDLSPFVEDTPLWFYILAEAQAPLKEALEVNSFEPFLEDRLTETLTNSTQLGWVGGRIIAEVFYGLIDSDPESFVNAAPDNWQPVFSNINTVLDLLKIADPLKVNDCVGL